MMIGIILQFLLMFSLILFLHEFGHFIAAKAFGVEVEEFGFGIPPRMIKLFTWKGTDFTLNWLPFGAFVKPKGEFDDADSAETGGFKSVSPWKQLVIYLAGPMMNLLTMIVVLMIIAQLVGIPVAEIAMIDRVLPDSPAEQAGFLPGDYLLSVNGEKITGVSDAASTFFALAGQENRIVFERDGQVNEVSVVTRENPGPGRGALGVELTNPLMRVPFIEGIRIGFRDAFTLIFQYLHGLGQLFSGQVSANEGLVGPIGIFSLYQDVAESDRVIMERQEERREMERSGEVLSKNSGADSTLPWYNRLMFFAVISMAVGISNLLPVPALDGGRILLLIPELIFRKRVPAKVEVWLNVVGMALVLGLSVYLIFKDVFQLAMG